MPAQSLLSLLATGLLLGVRHAFEPDHLAAVANLTSRVPGWRRAAAMGIAWGTGHTVSVALVALALVAFGVRVPARGFLLAEGLVAALLVALGVGSLRASRGGRDGAPTVPGAGPAVAEVGARGTTQSLGFGLAHGAAGSGAVMALIVGVAPLPGERALYLGAFGLGTIAGMTGASLATTVALRGTGRSAGALIRWRRGLGAVSIVVGAVLGWRVLGAALA